MTRPTKLGSTFKLLDGALGYDPDADIGDAPAPDDRALDVPVFHTLTGTGTLAYRSSSANSATAATSISASLPAGTAVGDALVAFVFGEDNANDFAIDDESGWTPTLTESSNHGALRQRHRVFVKAVETGEAAPTFDFTISGTVDYVALILVAVQGAAGAFITYASETELAVLNNFTGPALTMAAQDAVLLASCNFSRGATTLTIPTGYTTAQASEIGGAGGIEYAVGYKASTGANPAGPVWDVTNGGDAQMFHIAIGASGEVQFGQVTDGDDATYDAMSGTEAFRLQLDAAYRIVRAELRIGTENAGSRTYSVYGANDADFTGEVLLDSTTFTATGSYTAQDVVFNWTTSTAYQYYRLVGDSETRRVYSFELYEASEGTSADLDAHLIDTTDAHDASAISIVDADGYFTGTDVEAALQELGAGLYWFNVEDYGAVHDGVTDDTVAIQAAITACHSAGGGTIFFPAGIYQVSGAMQSTSTWNSQLTIPYTAYSASSVAIRFLGSGPNRVYKGEPPGGGEAILRSDWSGTISGHPALLSAGLWRDLGGGSGGQSNVQIAVQDMTIICPDNPKLSALQLTCASTMFLRNVQLRTTSEVPSGYPSNANAAGVEGPFGVSYVPEEYSNVAILGYYTGIVPSEQAYGTLSFAFCTVGMAFIAQQNTSPYIRWPNQFPKLTFVSCQRGITVSGTGRRWLTGAATFEHDPAPFTTTYDIDDSGNLLHGFLSIHPTDYTTGPTDLLVNNAQRLSYHQPDQDWWRLHSQVHIPTGTDPTSNPYSGRTVYAASATGHLTVRTTAGGTVDLEDKSPTGAAGGDLSGTYPNPSVTDDSHSHTVATLPATTGEILISDTPAGSPLVFADLLQNEAGTDLLYAD